MITKIQIEGKNFKRKFYIFSKNYWMKIYSRYVDSEAGTKNFKAKRSLTFLDFPNSNLFIFIFFVILIANVNSNL